MAVHHTIDSEQLFIREDEDRLAFLQDVEKGKSPFNSLFPGKFLEHWPGGDRLGLASNDLDCQPYRMVRHSKVPGLPAHVHDLILHDLSLQVHLELLCYNRGGPTTSLALGKATSVLVEPPDGVHSAAGNFKPLRNFGWPLPSAQSRDDSLSNGIHSIVDLRVIKLKIAVSTSKGHRTSHRKDQNCQVVLNGVRHV